MIEKFMPDIYQKSIYYINYDKLYKKGYNISEINEVLNEELL